MRTLVPIALVLIGCALTAQSPPAANVMGESCAPLGASFVRTTLYFGLTRPSGTVSETQWQIFLRNEVTPRFPDGLTVWEANGQWRRADGRISREKAKVLLLVHEDTAAVRTALGAIVAGYKRAFQQESVLWESARVCAAF
jgi:Protein of unknown function (DUF3574)